MGRTVMKAGKQEPQAVISMKILEGLDGKEKMSKSLDNYIAIADAPEDMYGKVMSLPTRQSCAIMNSARTHLTWRWKK